MKRAMRRMRKMLILVACVALIAGLAIGGTLAWLQDVDDPVTNTFTPTNIDVELDETTDDNNDGKFQIIPSVDIAKDPKVTASSNVDYYVFVKVTETNWNTYFEDADKLTYSVDTSVWTQLTGSVNGISANEKVYYAAVDADTAFAEYVLTGTGDGVYENGVVYVPDTLTKEDLAKINDANNYPKLTFTAYAFQQANGDDTADGKFTALEAWNTLFPANN